MRKELASDNEVEQLQRLAPYLSVPGEFCKRFERHEYRISSSYTLHNGALDTDQDFENFAKATV